VLHRVYGPGRERTSCSKATGNAQLQGCWRPPVSCPCETFASCCAAACDVRSPARHCLIHAPAAASLVGSPHLHIQHEQATNRFVRKRGVHLQWQPTGALFKCCLILHLAHATIPVPEHFHSGTRSQGGSWCEVHTDIPGQGLLCDYSEASPASVAGLRRCHQLNRRDGVSAALLLPPHDQLLPYAASA
jgi:hypothetical protein